MTSDDLLNLLRDLRQDDFKDFKRFLQQDDLLAGYTVITRDKLEDAKRRETVDLLVQTYTLPGALHVTENILKTINRDDLVQRLSDVRSEPEGNDNLRTWTG